jgi:hypothetical protein
MYAMFAGHRQKLLQEDPLLVSEVAVSRTLPCEEHADELARRPSNLLLGAELAPRRTQPEIPHSTSIQILHDAILARRYARWQSFVLSLWLEGGRRCSQVYT